MRQPFPWLLPWHSMNMTVIDCIMGLNQWERGGRDGGGSTRAALHSLPHLISFHFISKPSCRPSYQHQHHRCTHCTRLHASHPQLRRTTFRTRRAYATERHQRAHGSQTTGLPPQSQTSTRFDPLLWHPRAGTTRPPSSLARAEAREDSPTGCRR